MPVAEKLDRAAERLRTSKRDVISALLAENLDEGAPASRPRRVVIEDAPERMTVGHASFTPAPAPEVLTLEDAAELLRVSPDALRERAEAGDAPGRRLGDDWRFSREALLAWLGAVA
ncbi:helix-turn-helix domain-containing protein [Capillimicrobium parvum]|uniref:helix-turn-helix domain-containing protein n=1 Tax=Capillimicrobium parvum TaxID=2884022 RepID=UPI00216AC921|nr:helix-turn-helix domain-containing protein [Capillimicrobium parvum]